MEIILHIPAFLFEDGLSGPSTHRLKQTLDPEARSGHNPSISLKDYSFPSHDTSINHGARFTTWRFISNSPKYVKRKRDSIEVISPFGHLIVFHPRIRQKPIFIKEESRCQEYLVEILTEKLVDTTSRIFYIRGTYIHGYHIQWMADIPVHCWVV